MYKTSEYFNKIFSVVNRRNTLIDDFYKQIDLSNLQASTPKKQENLLDLGCGLAPYSTILASEYENIYLIDSSIIFLRKAEKNLRRKYTKKNIFTINSDINDLASFNIPEIDLIIATGASLCYQKHTLIAGLEKSFNILRKGGIIYGDIWNKYGILITDAYSDDLPLISLKSSFIDLHQIKEFLDKGITSEIVNNHCKKIYATDSDFLTRTLLNVGFKDINLYGRKTLYLIWPKTILNDMIIKNYEYTFELEKLLSKIDFYMYISPKISFLARKE